MRFLLSILSLILLATVSFAQNGPATGTVVDEKGEPMIGVTVKVSGTTIGTVTDLDGNFSVTLPKKKGTLTFSFVGYRSVHADATQGEKIPTVRMEPIASEIDEVVVIGYGTAKKSELTSSIETVTAKDLAKIPAMNLDQSLAGQSAGLGVQASTGDPSSAKESKLSIRGNVGDPLLVIDGVPRFGTNTNEGEMRLSDLNPDDIESISILKDAAAAAVYGARAANGVILVQTKRGKAGSKARINYRGQFNFEQATYLPKFLGAEDFAMLYNRAVEQNPDGGYTAYDISKFGTDPNLYGDTNLLDYFHKWGHSQRHSLSVSGGSEKIRYHVSGGVSESKGLYSNIGRMRYTYAAKLDAEIFKGLTLSANLTGAVQQYKNNNDPVTIDGAYAFSPIEVLTYTNGAMASLEGSNPLISVLGLGGYQKTNSDFHTLNARLTYDIPKVDGLSIYASATFDMNHTNVSSYSKPVELSVYDPLTGSITTDPSTIYPLARISMNDRHQYVDNMLIEGGISYHHTFAEKHNVSGLVVINYQDYHNKYMRGINNNLSGEKPEVMGNTSTGSLSGSEYYSQRASTVGRVTYGFDNRYFAEFSFRVDGSTRFAPGKRWGFFPTASASWVISNEKFFHVSPAILSQAKIRGSFGILGDDGVASDFGYMQYYNFTDGEGYNFGGVWSPGLLPSLSSYPNTSLTWGKSQDVNIGIDLGFWNNRVTATLEWYQRMRSNMVTDARSYLFPPTVGTGGVLPSVNVGKVRFHGFDFTISHNNSVGDFDYDISFNIGTSSNKVLDWGDESSVNPNERRAGHPYSVWSLYEADGLFQSYEEIAAWDCDQDGYKNSTLAPGDIKYKDQDGDGRLTTNDMIFVKNSALPDIFYGFGLGGSWKGIHLNLSFQGMAGYNQMINEVYTLESNSLQRFQDYHLTDTWTPENPNAGYPRIKFASTADNNRKQSTYWIKECSFLRLKALTVGYSFPSSILKKARMQSLDVSFQASNLFTLSSLHNMDPESLRGYPLQRGYGVSLSFGF